MTKLVLNDIVNINTAITALNDNFTRIEQAIENTVSRDGTIPNTLTGDLDLNSNDLLNVGVITATDAIIGGNSVAGSATLARGYANEAFAYSNVSLANAQVAVAAQVSASASASIIVNWDYVGNWLTATNYNKNNIIYNSVEGNSYICLATHTSGVFGTDYGDGKWGLIAIKGAAGAGTGDMLKADNLLGLANYATARTNMGLAIGVDVQAQDATLQALAGTLTAANKIPYATALNSAAELDFKNEADMVSNSATAVPSQQSVKTFVEALLPAGAVMQFAMSTAPTGWLKANGLAVSRTTYATLFAAIGITFGAGDGVTTFNLPDLRGEFLRGFDDLRGVDSGRVFGSVQADDSRRIVEFDTEIVDGGTGVMAVPNTGVYSGYRRTGELGTASRHSIRFKTNTVETRPRNIALLTCIKY